MAARYGAITRGGAGVCRARSRMNPEQDWEPIIMAIRHTRLMGDIRVAQSDDQEHVFPPSLVSL